MLPTVGIVKDGKVTDYIVGFDDLGGSDSFPTSALAARCVWKRHENFVAN